MVVKVAREWPGATVVILATGPSLTQDDVNYCRGKARVIAVNDAYLLAPWADCLYASDGRWWHWNKGVPTFTGPKWSIEHSQWNNFRAVYTDVQRLRSSGPNGLEHDPTALRTGRNSGFAALNLAFHYGVNRIVMLGFDMQCRGGKSHFFGEHRNRQQSPYPMFRRAFDSLVKPLKKAGVEVVNCSLNSALTCFPKADLRQVLVDFPRETRDTALTTFPRAEFGEVLHDIPQ